VDPGLGGTGSGGNGGEGGGLSTAGNAGAPPEPLVWCAVAPWQEESATFTGESGTLLPAGKYLVRYEGGAQIHDRSLGYEVTDHYYGKGSIEAGHHIYSGESPETGDTSLWLIDEGLVGGATIADVEAANRGYTWPLEHAGGELHVTLYDDYLGDNAGPGTQLCITPVADPEAATP
jgi:hypothetical protein